MKQQEDGREGKQRGVPRLPVDQQFQIVLSELSGEMTMVEAAR